MHARNKRVDGVDKELEYCVVARRNYIRQCKAKIVVKNTKLGNIGSPIIKNEHDKNVILM